MGPSHPYIHLRPGTRDPHFFQGFTLNGRKQKVHTMISLTVGDLKARELSSWEWVTYDELSGIIER